MGELPDGQSTVRCKNIEKLNPLSRVYARHTHVTTDTDGFAMPLAKRKVFLGIKHELKELQMNVYDMFRSFWRGKPSDNERRWRRFELCECFYLTILLWAHYTRRARAKCLYCSQFIVG